MANELAEPLSHGTALDAVGNPTRRAVLRLLRDGERTVREMTDALPVTQSAVSQHLKVLHDAGLVRVRAEGTRRLYTVDLGGLASVRAWVDSFWDDVLAAFTEYAASEEPASENPESDEPTSEKPESKKTESP